MIRFLNRFNLLKTNQIVFLAGQNTSDVFNEFVDKAYDTIELKRVLLNIFIDFSKVFDTVDREIHLEKNV